MFPDKIKGADNVTREHRKQATRTVSRAEAHPLVLRGTGHRTTIPTDRGNQGSPPPRNRPPPSERQAQGFPATQEIRSKLQSNSENTARKQIYKNAQES